MSATLFTAPPSRLLTTVARVQSEASISGNDTLLADLVEQASDLIELWAGRPLYRAQWVETHEGNTQTKMGLWRYPIVSLETVTYQNSLVTDVSPNIPNSGSVYRKAGFSSASSPSEWSFTYTAGWVVPAVNITSASITASSSDNSYNGTFPELLRPGDILVAGGFTDPDNNGTKIIGTASTTKLEVTTALVDEAAAPARVLRFHNLPGWIERVVIDLVKTAYTERSASQALTSITIGDASMDWSESAQVAKRNMEKRINSLARLNF